VARFSSRSGPILGYPSTVEVLVVVIGSPSWRLVRSPQPPPAGPDSAGVPDCRLNP
jgi:hypothetical protein